MSGSVGRYAVWDDNKGYPTHRVDDVPARSDEDETRHIHIHLPAEIIEARRTSDRPARSRGDANTGASGERNTARRNGGLRDQGEEDPSEQPDCGPLIARIRQSGETGEWEGELADDGGENGGGTPLKIKQDPQGGLLIHHALAENGEAMDANAEKLGLKRPPGAATLDSYSAFDERALAELQRTGSTQDGYAASRAFAKKMSAAFAPKRRG
jgi:hypothetical protein